MGGLAPRMKNIVIRLINDRQRKMPFLGGRDASALAIVAMEPPSKKVKKIGAMFLAGPIGVLSKELRRKTAQQEHDVMEMRELLATDPHQKCSFLGRRVL